MYNVCDDELFLIATEFSHISLPGFIYDATKNYNYVFYVGGSCITFGALIFFTLQFKLRKSVRRTQYNVET